MRRLRQADWTRRLVRENVLTPNDFIWSMVVHEGEGRVPVTAMPGVDRLSVKEAANAAREARRLGIPAVAIGASMEHLPHRLEEFAEASSIVPGIKSLVVLAVSLTTH